SLGNRYLEAVDAHPHRVDGPGYLAGGRLVRLHCHRAEDLHDPPKTVEAARSNGQPPCLECSMYSSLKYLIDETTGLTAPSPNGQKARPRMLSQISSSLSRSASLPSPRSS